MKGKFILTRVLTLECSGDLKGIQLELQVLGYSIYTILIKTYQPIGYGPNTVLLRPFVRRVWPVTPNVHYPKGSKVHVICDRCPFWDCLTDSAHQAHPGFPICHGCHLLAIIWYKNIPCVSCLLYFPFILTFMFLLIYRCFNNDNLSWIHLSCRLRYVAELLTCCPLLTSCS